MNRLTRKLREHAPVAAWAKRLGINRVTLQKILAGHPEVKSGIAAKRLVLLIESLQRGEWRWICQGDPHLTASYRWEGEAPFEKDSRPALAISLAQGGPQLQYRRV